jgi:hypothetical protein
MRRCLSEIDVPGIRALWHHVAPGMPQPKDDAAALAMIHHTRTLAEWLNLTLRAYSHRWLLDHDLPSGLPDDLKPRAERLYPVKAEAVGISINGGGIFAPIIPLVRGAMEDAVLECFADGHKETEIVRPRMFEARAKVVRELLGVKR